MKNDIESGHILKVARAALSVSGVPYDLGSGLVGVALGDYAANESGNYDTSGVKSIPKRSADVYVLGVSVGYDDANDETVTLADIDQDFILGNTIEAAGNGVLSVKVLINNARGPGPSKS
tara:strand:+ start:6385 stop:6744 length:360 start_codon:yes stop_codon:yes gene_type:complete